MNRTLEDERRRVVREIHDGPAQVLANAIFGNDIAIQVSRRARDELPDELVSWRSSLKEGLAEVRRFMIDLRPAMLEQQVLVPTLRHFARAYQRFFGTRVDLEGDETLPSLTREEELTDIRII